MLVVKNSIVWASLVTHNVSSDFRGIPGKSCGAIIVKAEELGNCRVLWLIFSSLFSSSLLVSSYVSFDLICALLFSSPCVMLFCLLLYDHIVNFLSWILFMSCFFSSSIYLLSSFLVSFVLSHLFSSLRVFFSCFVSSHLTFVSCLFMSRFFSSSLFFLLVYSCLFFFFLSHILFNLVSSCFISHLSSLFLLL